MRGCGKERRWMRSRLVVVPSLVERPDEEKSRVTHTHTAVFKPSKRKTEAIKWSHHDPFFFFFGLSMKDHILKMILIIFSPTERRMRFLDRHRAMHPVCDSTFDRLLLWFLHSIVTTEAGLLQYKVNIPQDFTLMCFMFEINLYFLSFFFFFKSQYLRFGPDFRSSR